MENQGNEQEGQQDSKVQEKSLPDTFASFIATSVDARGVYPQQAIIKKLNGDIQLVALMLEAPQVYEKLVEMTKSPEVAEFIFGIDRYSKPGQGFEFADFVSVHYFNGFFWKFGIIEYQYVEGGEPIVKPINWEMTEWNEKMAMETAQYFPGAARTEPLMQ